MSTIENEFYVGLLSNGSLNIYPENTQSAFTNVLAKNIKINEQWCVGLTEVFLNPFALDKSGELARFVQENDTIKTNVLHCCACKCYENENKSTQTRANSPESVYSGSDPIDDSVEEFETEFELEKKRQKIKDGDNLKFSISLNQTNSDYPYYIEMNANDLLKYSYENYNINLGGIFNNLKNHIYPKITPTNITLNNVMKESILFKMREEMLNFIDSTDLKNIPFQTIAIDTDDFLVHVYMKLTKPQDKIVLKYLKYTSDEFLTHIIKQIPKKRRDVDKLKDLLNYFYRNLITSLQTDVEVKKKVMKISFKEFGFTVDVKMDTKLNEIRTQTLTIPRLIELFRENLIFDQQYNHFDEKEIKAAVRQSILNIVKTFQPDPSDILMVKKLRAESNDFYLDIPIKTNHDGSQSTKTVVVETKEYNNFDDFIRDLFNQIPVTNQNKVLLLESIQQGFATDKSIYLYKEDTQTALKNTQKETISQTELKQSDSKNAAVKNNVAAVNEKEVKNPSSTKPSTKIGIPKIPKYASSSDNNISTARNNISTNNTSYLYIYTDIVKPRSIADNNVRYLRVIPLNNKSQNVDAVHIKFENIEYVRLEQTYIENISILITDGFGKQINFSPSTSPVYVMLHFKKM